VKIKSSREAAVRALIECAEKDSRIVLVSPDSVLAGRMLPFSQRFPNRVFEVGIAEQCAVDAAAGLASVGMRPVVISYAGFLTMRACEMIRTFVAYPRLDVKFIGLNGGMLGGEREGVTHQFYEDVGILRAMPGVTVFTPSDAGQAYRAALAMMDNNTPCYLRLASGREPDVFPEETPFEAGKIRKVLHYGDAVAVFCAGFLMSRAMETMQLLKGQGVNGTLYDVSTVKPLDTEGVVAALQKAGCGLCIEDHNIYGGLGSAVCETACRYHPCKVVCLGLPDVYPRSGHADALLDAYGLSTKDMVNGALCAMTPLKSSERRK